MQFQSTPIHGTLPLYRAQYVCILFDCEQEDLAALRCTSAQLLASARANCQFCQFAHAAMKCRRISLSICMYANEKRQRRREGWRLGRADAIGMYIWFGSSVVVGSVRS